MKKLTVILCLSSILTGCNVGQNAATSSNTAVNTLVAYPEGEYDQFNESKNTSYRLGYVHGESEEITKLPALLRTVLQATVIIKNIASGAVCTGVMLDQQTVKTAAHCIDLAPINDHIIVRQKLSNINSTENYQTDYIDAVNINKNFLKYNCKIGPFDSAWIKKCSRYDEADIKFQFALKYGVPLTSEVNRSTIPAGFLNSLGVPMSNNQIFAVGYNGRDPQPLDSSRQPSMDFVYDKRFGGQPNNLVGTLDVLTSTIKISGFPIEANAGSSGGPLYACKPNATECILIGLLSSGAEPPGVEVPYVYFARLNTGLY